uniref:Uncharacterized protein n=1 Tax=Anguilla anguilla TaxID=7936 RepID=A0A0E9RVT7_ANGAN
MFIISVRASLWNAASLECRAFENLNFAPVHLF